MTTPTFTPILQPSFPIDVEYELKITKASYGDGYIERSPEGLNYRRAKVSLTWENVTAAEETSLMNFFKGKDGYLPFFYQPPHDDFSVPLKWIAPKFRASKTDAGNYVVRADLEQVFDLGA